MTVLILKSDYNQTFKQLEDLTRQISLAVELKAFSITNMYIMQDILNNANIKSAELSVFATNADYTKKTLKLIYGAKLTFDHIINNTYILKGEYNWKERESDEFSLTFSPENFSFTIEDITSVNKPVLFASNFINGPFGRIPYNYSEYITDQALTTWKMNSRKDINNDRLL